MNIPMRAVLPMPVALERLRGGLIVSCQAPVTSALHDPRVIAAMASASVSNGAVGVRIDSPAHVQAVRTQVTAPIIGLWKVVTAESEVYITPTVQAVMALKSVGADLIAVDATGRPRPGGETLAQIIEACHTPPFCPVLADVSTLAEAQAAIALGADAVATTLFGYTVQTAGHTPPGWVLLQVLLDHCTVPVLLEGGVQTPHEVHQALALGTWAVVVGGALTGLDQRVRQFCP